MVHPECRESHEIDSYTLRIIIKTFSPFSRYSSKNTISMASLKSSLIYSIVGLFLIPTVLSCVDQKEIGEPGVLTGKISIGPLCPVETIPPSPGCSPTAETYIAWATAVWNTNKSKKVATLHPTLDGKYQIVLPSGKYVIDFDSNQTFRAGSNLPSVITVLPNDTLVFNITIDTGIR